MLPALLAILSGALFAWSFPNVAQGWLAFVAPIPLVIVLVRVEKTRNAFALGWISQTVAWLIMVPWVVRVMTRYGGLPYPAGVLIFLAMSVFLGLYGGLFGIVVHRMRLGQRFLPWLLVPLAWAATEYVRTYMFTGFPWNLIATALVDYPSLIQIDRVAGPYFVGALMMLPAAVAAWWITQRPPQIARVIVAGATGILLMVWWGTGLIASKFAVRPNAASPIKAALLQPNIAQEMRWDESNVLTIYERMIGMTVEAAKNGAKVVVWPESTVPLSYTQTDAYRNAIEAISRDFDVDIILGSVATDPARVNRLWNSAFLASGGTTVGHYDKIRLVPFGEYVPMREVLFFAEKLVRAVGEFEFGTNDKPLAGKLKYGPAICYEIVYPQITRQQIRNGADVLVTITNDAWFDGSSAPAQHLWQARLRAVEGDRYLLRAATTGISAFIDPAGQVVESRPMNVQGIIYAEFQPRTKLTPYVRMGDWFAWVAVVAVMGGIILRRRHGVERTPAPA